MTIFRSSHPADSRSFRTYEATTLDAYKKIGSRNPKWDASAIHALQIYARDICDPEVVAGTTNYRVMADEFKKAVAAGCDDPLVRYADARLADREVDANPFLRLASYHDTVEGLKAHPYPAIRQAFMYARAGQYAFNNSAGRSDRAERMLEMCAIKLAEAIKERADRDEIYQVSGILLGTTGPNGRKNLFDFLQARFAFSGLTNNPVALVVEARFFVLWGWDARGNSSADTVTTEGWRLFEQRLAEARNDLQRAWDADPSDAEACAQMIEACAATGQPSEIWFQRGKEADPACYAVYATRANYLQDRWGGSDEALLQFARDCVAEGNWVERVPFILSGAYDMLGWEVAERPRAWAEMQSVYEHYLQLFPGNNAVRSAYCHRAVGAKQWDFAGKLLDQMGDLVVPGMFSGGYYTEVREIATNRLDSAPLPQK